MSYQVKSSKIDLKPKRHHGYSVVLFIMGTLFPPLAVAARFGIGGDFWLNLLLTICGYIPGHVHNFYIQNIRNNKTHARTPKWAQRYGLINTDEIKRKERKSQWATRYNERLPHSALEGQELEEGETEGPSGGRSREDSILTDENGRPRRTNTMDGETYWRAEEERYYGQNNDSRSMDSGGRWHYPANFDESLPPIEDASGSGGKKKKKKVKKDRWARTEDAYSLPDEDQGKKKKKKKKKNRSTVGNGETESFDRRSESTTDFPESADGGLYSERRNGDTSIPSIGADGLQRDELEHQF